MNLYLLEKKLKNLIRKEIDKEKAAKILEKLKVFLIEDETLGDYSTNLIFLLKQFAPEKEKEIVEKIKHRMSGNGHGISGTEGNGHGISGIGGKGSVNSDSHEPEQSSVHGPEPYVVQDSVLSSDSSVPFKKIDIVNNYLNFWLSDYQLLKTFRSIYKNFLSKTSYVRHRMSYLQQNYGKKQKLNIDYVSANPTGPLTLGNARGAVLGDSLANILKLSGFRVTKEYYVNDRGNQIEILGKTVLAHLGYLNWENNFYQGEYLKDCLLYTSDAADE